MTKTPNFSDRVTGCLLGGALGDALGWPVEFLTYDQIRAAFPGGVAPAREFCITDDTQMTLFTLEGLIEAQAGGDQVRAVHEAYLRWLDTQGYSSPAAPRGSLQQDPLLRHDRAAGGTCISALKSGRMGTVQRPLNDSKGCGGIMRIAPAAIFSSDPFDLACDLAAITHGHPSGYLSAGAFAVILREIFDGASLPAALSAALDLLPTTRGTEGETAAALQQAIEFRTAAPTPDNLARLGLGWIGEEALAIAVWCVLVEPDPIKCLQLAVTHSGDSDSTGALVGNLLGAMYGPRVFPASWSRRLIERKIVERMTKETLAALPAPVNH